jgi:uncharacterized protein (DUF924 family)
MGHEAQQAILSFWFGELDGQGRSDPAHAERWWRRDPAFDDEVRQRFGALVEAALDGQLDDWSDQAHGCLAHVLLLDQMTRNIFRGSARAFDGDGRALIVAEGAIARGFDKLLAADPRGFLYMPLMHAEDLLAQNRAVELFQALRDDQPAEHHERGQIALDFAIRHRDIVERFGRFPHRNELLGRESTAEEREFLTQPGSRF